MSLQRQQRLSGGAKAGAVDSDRMSQKSYVPATDKRMAMYNHGGWSGNKDEQRRFVIECFCDLREYRPRSLQHYKLLSLPGERWDMEKMFLRTFQKSSIVGVECSTVSFETGFRQMPYATASKRSSLTFGHRECDVVKQGACTLVNCHLDQMLFSKPTGSGSKAFRSLISNLDFVYLDTNSPAGTKRMVDYARAVPRLLNRERNCAIALTFIVGRDDPAIMADINVMPGDDAVTRRINFLRMIINGAGCKRVMGQKHHVYTSAGDESSLQMCTVVFFIGRRVMNKPKKAILPAGEIEQFSAYSDDAKSKKGSMADFISSKQRLKTTDPRPS